MHKHKILLIDDEQPILNALTRVFHNSSYELFTATSAEQALGFLERNNIDLIICDYQLGGMNGIDFLENISKDNPDIINILLTAHADLDMAIDAINRAVLYKFIMKPWNDNNLLITVRRALEQRDLIIENKRLMNEIKKRDIYIKQLEKESPGITDIKRDDSGNIIIE